MFEKIKNIVFAIHSIVTIIFYFLLFAFISSWKIFPEFIKEHFNIVNFGISLLFVLSIYLFFNIRYQEKKNVENKLRLSIKNWINIEANMNSFFFIVCFAVISIGIWFGYLENESRRHEKFMALSQKNIKPTYVSWDEWHLTLGISSYKEHDYDKALFHFDQITELKEAESIRWKLFESLAKLRILEHKKFVQLQQVDEEEIEIICHTLNQLRTDFPQDKYAETINYWYGQLLYHFKGENEIALSIFKNLFKNMKYGQWTNGAKYYSAKILSDKGDISNLEEAEMILVDLLKDPFGLIRIVKDGLDYRVEQKVPELIQMVRSKLKTIKNSNR